MANRVAGICYTKIDGAQITLGEKLTVNITRTQKEGVVGLSGVVGYKETFRVPSIEVEAFIKDLPIAQIEAGTNLTITAELATGQAAVLSSAWLKESLQVEAADGKVNLIFEGLEGRWLS